MKIHPENRIKTTGIIPKTGGLFCFRVMGVLSAGKYKVLLSGKSIQIKSPEPLDIGKEYKALFQYKDEKIYIKNPEMFNSRKEKMDRETVQEQGIVPIWVDNLTSEEENKPAGSFLPLFGHEQFEVSEKELFILEPLIILYKQFEYKGTLSLYFNKKNRGKIFNLDLEKDGSLWRFRLSHQDQKFSIKAFCSIEKLPAEIQKKWTQLCGHWEEHGIEADKTIKILRSFTENTENIREEMYRIVDIEV